MFSRVNERVVKNILALSILQGGNYLLPLILTPYLVRTLGIDAFGKWAFAISFVAIFRTVISYGFDLTATRVVSLNRSDTVLLSELYAVIVIIRLVLLSACCAILYALAVTFQTVSEVFVLSIVSMLALIGEAIFPVWFFQGIERMSWITKVRLTYKAAFVILVVVFVDSADDLMIIPCLDAILSLIAGIVAFLVASSQFRLSFNWPALEKMSSELRSGAPIFFSNLVVHFYSTINMIVLGSMLGPVAVGQYSIADKAYSAIRGMLGPVVQALFPYMTKVHMENVAGYVSTARRVILGFSGGVLLLAIALFFLSNWVVEIIAGQPIQEAIFSLQILSVSLCFAFGSLLSPLLVIQGKSTTMLIVTVVTAIANLVIVYPLIYYFGVVGAALAFLGAQALHAFLQIMANKILFGRNDLKIER